MQSEDGIDRALEHLPVWEPPAGFAEAVARRAVETTEPIRPTIVERPTSPFAWPLLLDTLGLAAGIGAVAYVLVRLFNETEAVWSALASPAPPVTWLWVAASYLVVARLTRSTA